MVRYYLNTYAVNHWVGRLFMRLYRRVGRKVAAWVKVSRTWEMLLRPLFEWLFRKARTVVPDAEQRIIFEEYWDTVRPRSSQPTGGAVHAS